MLSRFRHLFGVVFFLLVASCSGGGCGGCAGMTPLPGGFPTDKAVENAASVRISRPGLDFMEKEIPTVLASLMGTPDGVFDFEVPPSTMDTKFGFINVTVSICPDGAKPSANPPTCVARIGIGGAKFRIDAVKPNEVRLDGVLPIKLEKTPLTLKAGVTISGNVAYGSNASCNGNEPVVGVKQLPVKVTIPIVAETTAPRTGYSKLDLDGATIDLSGVEDKDVRVCVSCVGVFDGICNSVIDFVKNRAVGSIKSSLEAQLRTALKRQLCTKPNPTLNPSCPTQSSPDIEDDEAAVCVYDSDKSKCVPMLLGTDGHVDLGGFLAAFSPGASGGLDFGLASFGAMRPYPNSNANAQGRTDNGITLGMIGGVLPQPPSKCVVQVPVTPPNGIPIPDELAPSSADAASAPHVGIALSGRFLDYSFTSLYNSGLLCLGVSTEQFDMLKSGLLAFLVPSLKTLTFEHADAAAAIATRPQAPPQVKIGGGTDPNKDPLLSLTLPKFAIDFYVWSFDRFARVFTYTADITIPINLQTAKGPSGAGEVRPSVGDLKVKNGAVSNSDILLFEQPDVLAGAVGGILGTVAGQLAGAGLPGFDLSAATASLGLGLNVDDIKKLTKGSDDFVGVFASMTKPSSAATAESDTVASLTEKKVWPEHLQAATYDRDKLPELHVALSSSLEGSGLPIEYSWWIDHGTRSPWSTERELVIKSDQLFFQGRRTLYVTSRVVGSPETEDTTPVAIPYVIDALAPFIKLEETGDAVTVTAWDLVSAPEALVARYRLDDAELGDWLPVSELANIDVSGADAIEVEVKDEEGNVGTVRQGLRGRVDPTLAAAGAGCGCSVPGSHGPGGGLVAVLLGLAGLALVVARRRGVTFAEGRRAATRAGVATFAIAAVAATSQGCGCGGDGDLDMHGCGTDCQEACLTGLEQGQPGAYLSVAKASDGTLWAAGYNDSLLSDATALLWGDLVVGTYDLGRGEVDWETVDGIPTRTDGTCTPYAPGEWRGGETDSGENVGRWASLQLSTSDEPMVSYYDDTNRRLKFAARDGSGWSVSVLREKPGADIGKYSKMLLVDGKPVIAFMQLEPGAKGRTRSKIVLARANTESPRGADDFSFEDVAFDDDGPCRADSCEGGQVCVKDTGTCTATVNGCSPGCGQNQACVSLEKKATCVATQGEVETYPRGLGPYISMAHGPKGLGIVAYDGYHGNLVGFAEKGAGKWERLLLDGETGKRGDKTAIDTGDVGIAASLAIDERGTWHVSYVSGLDETLRYIAVVDGKPGRSDVVDDGTTVDGKRHPDGKHIVGDDSIIRIDGGTVTIYYADSSSLGLRRAVGTGLPNPKWELRSFPQENRWMAFPQFVPGEDDKVAVWWRRSSRETRSVEGNVTVLSP